MYSSYDPNDSKKPTPEFWKAHEQDEKEYNPAVLAVWLVVCVAAIVVFIWFFVR